MLAAALTDGSISLATFTDERIRDCALRPLMNRISMSENPEFTHAFPRAMMNRIEIVTRSGTRYVEEGQYPKGHLENPMTDAEVEQTYRLLCGDALGTSRTDEIAGSALGDGIRG